MSINFDSPRYTNPITYNSKNRAPWREAEARIQEMVRFDLEDEYLEKGAPQELRDKVWSLAWGAGHSYGYSEVELHYDHFSELATLAYTLGRRDEKNKSHL